MEVILLERVEKLGQMGEVVNVKAGYARNFLLPQRKALRATKENMSYFETQRVQLEAANLEQRSEAERVSTDMAGLAVILIRQASDSAQLYGSVTTRDIALAVGEAGYTITRNQVKLARPIKSLGMHPVRVRLHPEVAIEITANVARSEEEAKAQARGEVLGAEDDEELAEGPDAFFEEGFGEAGEAAAPAGNAAADEDEDEEEDED